MQPINRRLALASLAALAGTSPLASAQGTPLRLVVPYPAGGPADIVARTFAQPFSEELGRPIVIDNRPGANGMLGATAVAKAAPDGNTLLLNPTIHVILPSLQPKVTYDAINDFTHVGVTAGVPLVLVVNDSVPVKTVEELAAYARQNPNKLSYATSSQGSSSHLAGEQFKILARADIQQVPYKGSAPAITDLIGGQVQMMFDSLPSMLPHVRSGKVRALAVTSPARSRVVPDLRTMEEAGFAGFVHTNWYGLWGPAGMPREATATLVAAMQKTLARTDLRNRLLDMGGEPITGVDGDRFKSFASSEMARYAKLVRDAGIKMD
jgi:tripartite-type tricarboxylate transporter receptor subunit TctC